MSGAKRVDGELTAKEKMVVEFMQAGDNMFDAGIKAGYSEATIRQIMYNVVKKPAVADALGQTVKNMKLTKRAALEPVVRGLKAKKFEKQPVKQEDGSVKLEYVEIDDLDKQLRAAAIAWRVLQDEEHVKEPKDPFQMPGLPTGKQLEKIAKNLDEVELQRIVFKSGRPK